MKTYITFITGLLFFIACRNRENSDHQAAELLKMNDNSSVRDTDSLNQAALFINFNSSLLEIQESLDGIIAEEKLLRLSSQDPELRKTKKEQIINDIQLIHERMNHNRQNLAVLNKKLADANSRIDSLQKTVSNLNFQLNNKKKEFRELNDFLTKISPEYSHLLSIYIEDKQEMDLKTEALNTAYYSVGTFKELEKKGIITKEGGFIGIGQRMELNKDFNQKKFTRINMTTLTEIPLDHVNKVTVITPHPSDAYKFIQDPFYSKLVITDALKFWSSSKFLVLVVEK